MLPIYIYIYMSNLTYFDYFLVCRNLFTEPHFMVHCPTSWARHESILRYSSRDVGIFLYLLKSLVAITERLINLVASLQFGFVFSF